MDKGLKYMCMCKTQDITNTVSKKIEIIACFNIPFRYCGGSKIGTNKLTKK